MKRFVERHCGETASHRQQPGVCRATTDDGMELPVVDVTNAAFACEATAAELEALAETTFRAFDRWARFPVFVQRWMLRRSLTARFSEAARTSFMSGMATYIFKLGPANLGPWATGIDRHLSMALSPVCVRLRLRAMARLLADGLAMPLATRGGPLSLLNIAGGTAIDSLNALILLQKESPHLLAGRRVSVTVLDGDHAGPHFGERALGALLAAGGPLHGVDARFEHVPYDWSTPSAGLGPTLAALDRTGVAACSSEGGLFEYGRDEDVLANLRVLRECGPADLTVVGSILRDGPTATRMWRNAKIPLWRQFAMGPFVDLVRSAGWSVTRVVDDNPLYASLVLTRSAGG